MQGPIRPATRRRAWLVGGLTALILGSALLVGYCWPFRRDGSAPLAAGVPRLDASPLTIVPGIHLLGGLSPAVAYVVETPEGLVLVDSGLEGNAGPLRQEMGTLGLDWRRARAILLTHVHGDHTGGAAYVRAATGAPIYAGQNDAAVLRTGGPPEAVFSKFFISDGPTHPTPVDVELKGDEVFEIGGARFQVLATPGHTPGSTCYLMERDHLRVLFSGDVIMSLAGDAQSHSLLASPLGTYTAYMAPRYRGDTGAFLCSLRRLRALPVPDLVLPGHPRMDPTPQSPALSQERWEALLDRGIRDMEELAARYEKDGAGFLDGVPKKLLPDLYYLGDFKGAAVYGFFASARFFLVDAPGGPGLSDFLNDSLQRLGLKPAAPAAVLLTSCDPEATAGLAELIEKTHAQVVASTPGLPSIRESCPVGTVFLSADDLPGKGWFDVKPIPLRGRGLAPIAYQLPWREKTILLSGRIPITGTRPVVRKLFDDFLAGRGNALDYADSVKQLGTLKPDLWLPASPTDGQNANLYGSEWEDIIAANRNLHP
jgi:glyoxylase-like metal-dependent hydrolase (beta-lactamase superfamily II)